MFTFWHYFKTPKLIVYFKVLIFQHVLKLLHSTEFIHVSLSAGLLQAWVLKSDEGEKKSDITHKIQNENPHLLIERKKDIKTEPGNVFNTKRKRSLLFLSILILRTCHSLKSCRKLLRTRLKVHRGSNLAGKSLCRSGFLL